MTYPIMIAGVGLITSLGKGAQAVLNTMKQGKNGFDLNQGTSDREEAAARVAPETISWPSGPAWMNREKYANRQSHLAVTVAQEAIKDSRIAAPDSAGIDPRRSGIIMTSGTSSNDELGALLPRLASESRMSSRSLSEFLYDEIPDYSYIKGIPSQIGQFVSDASNFRGSNVAAYGEGSCGGLAGLSLALDSIISGELDRVMVVGVSILPSVTLADAFSRVEPFAPRAVDGRGPSDMNRCGSLLGEAAVAIIVERKDLWRHTMAKRSIQVVNAATAVAPSVQESLKAALHDLKDDVDDTDVWWANGAGTRQLDAIEAETVSAVVRAPATASKGTIGDALECSALVDVVLAAENIGENLIPPVGLTSQVDPYLGGIDVVVEEPRRVDAPLGTALITSLSHGWDCPSAGAVVIRDGDE
ncbi:beta-ketoacyl synthase N-terminal-like domain-containing protein [uncultured Propionibacterium sp.]|uniref:beta-ketoacyl synthase N-terminal-like domain-containing protein n=1 Tax=uncultured Propionibacterium sp. TaxID=218066 RepID=UPI002930FEB3|nr:beta-ketoacyl synthase N-terminal-like domain-containing protein [uncultured Propionibacterium sp.]